jgi:hypothetical protein
VAVPPWRWEQLSSPLGHMSSCIGCYSSNKSSSLISPTDCVLILSYKADSPCDQLAPAAPSSPLEIPPLQRNSHSRSRIQRTRANNSRTAVEIAEGAKYWPATITTLLNPAYIPQLPPIALQLAFRFRKPEIFTRVKERCLSSVSKRENKPYTTLAVTSAPS